MVYSASKKTSSISTLTAKNQGGGNKKAGFPYQVGRTTAASLALGTIDLAHGHCCKLGSLQLNLFPNARPSRPIGTVGIAGYNYYHVPGTG